MKLMEVYRVEIEFGYDKNSRYVLVTIEMHEGINIVRARALQVAQKIGLENAQVKQVQDEQMLVWVPKWPPATGG